MSWWAGKKMLESHHWVVSYQFKGLQMVICPKEKLVIVSLSDSLWYPELVRVLLTWDRWLWDETVFHSSLGVTCHPLSWSGHRWYEWAQRRGGYGIKGYRRTSPEKWQVFQFSFELWVRTGDCSRDTAGPNRPHLGLCPGPIVPLLGRQGPQGCKIYTMELASVSSSHTINSAISDQQVNHLWTF